MKCPTPATLALLFAAPALLLSGCEDITYVRSTHCGDSCNVPDDAASGPLSDSGSRPWDASAGSDGGPSGGKEGGGDGGPTTQLRVATWNLEWLAEDDNSGPVKRGAADYEAMRRYAQDLNADVIALQEVQSEAAARRVFDEDTYAFAISSRESDQRTGFAYRKSLDVTRHPDVTSLDVKGDGRLRYGVDLAVRVRGHELRLLAVHLKSFCFDEPLDSSSSSCQTLRQQVPRLEAWIDARAAEGVPFLVLGDFNRRFDDDDDTMFDDLSDGVPANASLLRVTEGRTSQCRDGEFPEYIDHILLDVEASDWLVGDTFSQLLYRPEDSQRVLSDHCPISVDLSL